MTRANQRTPGAVPRSSLYRLADKQMGGKLAETLIALRSTNPPTPWEDISRRLHSEHDLTVTRETLRAWGTTLLSGAKRKAS